MSNLISSDIGHLKSKIEQAAKDLHALTIRIKNEELMTTVSEIRDRIQEPFMFVIVGEVKVGKSSFINALLESKEEICKVAPSPMTDTIQQIVYGDKHSVAQINPYLKRITEPIEILKEVAIVDTPGTNTIVEHHQEITERFIPSADLIIFVFEAKNPYRQSAWDFFDYIKSEWHKKIVFVLQQKDLMPAEDLAINEKGLTEFAQKKGVQRPNIFSVSAKQEVDGNHVDSGFGPLRDYIKQNITGGKAPVLKLINNINTCQSILAKLSDGLEDRKAQYESDVHFREDINQTLNDHERISNNQVQILVENLVAGYDQITRAKEKELRQGLGFFSMLRRSLASVFSEKQSPKQWLADLSTNLERDLNDTMRKKLNHGVQDISDSIQQMAQVVGLKLKNSQTILSDNHEIFSEIADRRANVLKELREAFSSFLNDSRNFYDQDLFPEGNRVAPNVATGTGIAILGAVLTALTNGMVLDITGGILTTIGLILAGVTLGFNKQKVLKKYNQEVDKGRITLENEVRDTLNDYIRQIKLKIDQNFVRLDSHLEREKKEITSFEEEEKGINASLKSFEKEIEDKTGLKFEI